MYCVLSNHQNNSSPKNISDWPKSGPVETGPTGPVATPLIVHYASVTRHYKRLTVSKRAYFMTVIDAMFCLRGRLDMRVM